ncbi:hypothetical protein SALBM217S_03387 [Streptomyces griseoloalbus]
MNIALHHLGLPGLRRERPLGTLSEGERSRLALAGVLAGRPELLLLDEPTNDLDDRAVEWLEAQLRAHRGTVLAVTHDRVFLERLTTTVLEAEEGKVTRYGDGYDGYRTAKAAERRRRIQEYEEWRWSWPATSGWPPDTPPASASSRARRRWQASATAASGPAAGRTVRWPASRNARERVQRLTAEAVAPPRPEPLAFAGVDAGTVRGRHKRRCGGPARRAPVGRAGG